MKRTLKKVKSGFTLIELLVVVLIIGILSAIALPMYRKAVESSRVTDALNTMQAVAKSEHGWYLANNDYTRDFSDLDIDLIDEDGNKADGESYETVNYTFTLQDTAIRADRNNGEYTLYKLYEDGNIYCSPQDHYICEQFDWAMNKRACDNLGAVWSNMKNKCFNTEGERCVANEMSYNENTGVCGCSLPWSWEARCNNVTINEGGQCLGNGPYDCNNSTITAGGECIGDGSPYVCKNITVTSGKCKGTGSDTCSYSTFTNSSCQGTCHDNEFTSSTCEGGCTWGSFTNSECIPSGNGCSKGTFSSSTCEGNYELACSSGVFEDGSICKANAQSACSKRYNTDEHSTFRTGSKCIGNADYGCTNAVFESGTTCEGNAFGACGWTSHQTTFETNSKCIANVQYSCYNAVYKAGSRCVAGAQNTCNNISAYQSGSCCENKEGTSYCPANAPKCHCTQNADGSYPTSC